MFQKKVELTVTTVSMVTHYSVLILNLQFSIGKTSVETEIDKILIFLYIPIFIE